VDFHVSLIGKRDLSGEIYRQLRRAILEGRLRGGEALPPTRELAARLNVARTTVNVAYDRLIGEGFATGKPGSGTYVTRHASRTSQCRVPHEAALRPRRIWEQVLFPTTLLRDARFDFRAGRPDERLFPHKTWNRLLARESQTLVGHEACGYPAGHRGLREAIAHHIAASRGLRVDADDVIVTAGAQQAIDLIARVLAAPGDRIAVEDPGYGPPRRLFAALLLQVCGVPVDEEGLVVDSIPAQTRLVYVSPSHQFPLGMSMSTRRRLALLEWARRTDAAIIEDDYDSEFRFDGRPIEPLHVLDAGSRVIYVGSFSKTMLPTLRLGFLVAPPSLRAALMSAKFLADWCSPLATQAALARFIKDGLFARHIRRMRTTYEARHRLIVDVLERTFANELEVVQSSVGLHVTALARDASVQRVDSTVQRASAAGLECTPLSMYAAGERRAPGFVLGYGAIACEQIEAGLALLRRAFDDAEQPGTVARIARLQNVPASGEFAMPTYEYRCKQCGKTFERSEHVAEHEKAHPQCPKCHSTKVEPVLADFYAKTSKKS
jgi:GntR family transcriptional regulator / MocR family aminotransferase